LPRPRNHRTWELRTYCLGKEKASEGDGIFTVCFVLVQSTGTSITQECCVRPGVFRLGCLCFSCNFDVMAVSERRSGSNLSFRFQLDGHRGDELIGVDPKKLVRNEVLCSHYVPEYVLRAYPSFNAV
jgi:hypothetical protein